MLMLSGVRGERRMEFVCRCKIDYVVRNVAIDVFKFAFFLLLKLVI